MYNMTAKQAPIIKGVMEFLIGAVIMGLTLVGLAYFDVAEGWRVPAILAISTVYLGVSNSVGHTSTCAQIWLADPMKSEE